MYIIKSNFIQINKLGSKQNQCFLFIYFQPRYYYRQYEDVYILITVDVGQ